MTSKLPSTAPVVDRRSPGRRAALAIFSIAVLGARSLDAVAQQPAARAFGDTIDVRVVNFDVVVTGPLGGPVEGLKSKDFQLWVDGVKTPVDYLSTPAGAADGGARADRPASSRATRAATEPAPTNYLVYLDEGLAIDAFLKHALRRLRADLASLHPQDRMAVLAASGEGQVAVISDWTADPAALGTALDKAGQRTAEGITRLARARGGHARRTSFDLAAAATSAAGTLRGFPAPAGRKVMVLLTAGWAVATAPEIYQGLADAANRTGYTLYLFDVGGADVRFLPQLSALARETGGHASHAALTSLLHEVAADAGTYYSLGVTVNRPADARFHSLRIAVSRPGATVRTRKGFFDSTPETQVADKAESVLLFGGAPDAAGRRLLIEPGTARPLNSATLELPVVIRLPVDALTIEHRASGYATDLLLAVTTMDDAGQRADQPLLHLTLGNDQAPNAGGYVTFNTTLDLRSARQHLVFSASPAQGGPALWGDLELNADGTAAVDAANNEPTGAAQVQ